MAVSSGSYIIKADGSEDYTTRAAAYVDQAVTATDDLDYLQDGDLEENTSAICTMSLAGHRLTDDWAGYTTTMTINGQILRLQAEGAGTIELKNGIIKHTPSSLNIASFLKKIRFKPLLFCYLITSIIWEGCHR